MGKARLAKSWASFEDSVLPSSASDVQRCEMRKAFYAGASCLFDVMMNSLSQGPDTEDADLKDDG